VLCIFMAQKIGSHSTMWISTQKIMEWGDIFFFFVVALFSLHKKENKNDNKKNSSKAKQIPQRHTHSVVCVCVCGDGCSVLSIFLCFFLLFLSYFLEGQRM